MLGFIPSSQNSDDSSIQLGINFNRNLKGRPIKGNLRLPIQQGSVPNKLIIIFKNLINSMNALVITQINLKVNVNLMLRPL